jgi:hypothetical protein
MGIVGERRGRGRDRGKEGTGSTHHHEDPSSLAYQGIAVASYRGNGRILHSKRRG